MIGPKEWSELKLSLTKLNPFLRIKKLKEILVQTSDASIKKEIKELILKAESESVDLFSRSEKVNSSINSLENLFDETKTNPEKRERTIEEIAVEDSTLTDSEINKVDMNYDPNEETDFYKSEGFYESVKNSDEEYIPGTSLHPEVEENDLNKSKDYINREEIEF